MYLHKDDKELLRDIIVTVSERTGIDESIVEKDYYVTLISHLKSIWEKPEGRKSNISYYNQSAKT